MRSVYVSVAFSMIFVLGVLAAPVNAETLASDLTIENTGADVALLQQFLVSKGFLEMPANVAYGYFGTLTQKALAQWQAFNNISPAVGYFGPISRGVLAAQMTAASPATPPNPAPASTTLTPFSFLPSFATGTAAAPGMRIDRVMLFRALPFEVRPGDSLTLDGSGFSKTPNKIYFNGSYFLTATSTDGTVMEVFVPVYLSEGEYKLSVSNELGSSDNPDIPVAIKITNHPEPGPTVESASIVGNEVILVGKGFTSANYLFTTFGNTAGPISSNGATLTFRVTDLSQYDQIKKSTLGRKYRAALWIFVENEHGINKEPYKLEIII